MILHLQGVDPSDLGRAGQRLAPPSIYDETDRLYMREHERDQGDEKQASNGQRERRTTSLRPGPLDAVDAADGLVRELREGGGREVEVPLRAADAAVGDGDGDGLAVVCEGWR